MTRRDRLVAFLEATLQDAAKTVEGGLDDGTSLIRSGLLDSLGILSLATWVDEELGGQLLDLESIDLANEWDSIPGILRSMEGR